MSSPKPADVAEVAEAVLRAVGLRSVMPVDRERVHRILLHWYLQILEQPANRLLQLREQAAAAEASKSAEPHPE